MFDYGDPERGIGLIAAAGALLPLLAWLALDRAGTRVRAVVAATGGLLLLVSAAGAFGRVSFVTTMLTTDNYGVLADESRRALDLALLVGGLLAGLALTLWLSAHAGDEAAEQEADEETEDGASDDPHAEFRPPPPPPPPIVGRTEVIGAEPSDHWTTHVVTRAAGAPLPIVRAPWSAGVASLFAVALGLALPMAPLFSDNAAVMIASRGGDLGANGVLSLLLFALVPGLALLVAALALDLRHLGTVAVAYGVLAVGYGVAAAYPDTVSNVRWTVLATGLVAGLVIPPALRLLGARLVEDRLAFGAGLVVALSLFVGYTTLNANLNREAYSDSFPADFDEDVDAPAVEFPEDDVLPTDFPTFVIFPTDFETP